VLERDADLVGLSGPITASLEEVCTVAAEMEHRGMNLPLLIGDATTVCTATTATERSSRASSSPRTKRAGGRS
jgi:cobalamin-dependent methionine synthase I